MKDDPMIIGGAEIYNYSDDHWLPLPPKQTSPVINIAKLKVENEELRQELADVRDRLAALEAKV